MEGALKRRPEPQRRAVTYFSIEDVWLFQARSDTKVCPVCLALEDEYEFPGNHLRGRFPYLQILDMNTIGGSGPGGTGLVHPNCRCYLVRLLEPEVAEYPSINVGLDILHPDDVKRAKKKLDKIVHELPDEHLDGLKTITVHRQLSYRDEIVGGLYYKLEDKIEVNYADLTLRGGGQEVVYHEVGHHVYDDILTDDQLTEWKGVWWDAYKHDGLPTEYASVNSDEGFAESYMDLQVQRVRGLKTSRLKPDSPIRKFFVKHDLIEGEE